MVERTRDGDSHEATVAVEAVWRDLALLFAPSKGIRFDASWLTGVASRAGLDRVERLRNTSGALKLSERLAGLDAATIRHLRLLAQINLDQANAAQRLTIIANISVPVALFVLANQFAPGRLIELYQQAPLWMNVLFLGFAGVFLMGVIWSVFAAVGQARDLLHLLMIEESRSGAASPSGPVEGEELPEAADLG